MGEGLVYKPVESAEIDAQLRLLAVEYLSANGDTDVEIVNTQIEYSNYKGYSYQVVFEANHSEQGMLEITFDNNNQPTTREI
jgi:hypothetical protein